MKITNIEEFMGTTIAKDALKKTMGDSPEFDIVYEALIQNSKNKETALVNTNKDEESNYLPTAVGQKLDNLPMKVRTESVDGIYNSTEGKENQNSTVNKGLKVDVNGLDSDKSRIYTAVDKYATQYGIDKNLVLGIIKQESNFDANAVSGSGAMGVMQLMDFNCEAYGITDPLNIEQNVEGGVKHIKEYLNMFNGNVEMALMAYNGGQGTMERRGVKSSNDLYKMPSETQNYVPKVMNYYKNGISA
ncbi:lytic transglycosylase domain-containing protein [Clostridium gasigenes]|uniref:lytic transglycosylase domain-containing protein n=1 Tax=Clostridium gasigenes TaxID=94869 RepID=UPI001C0E4550|nr:lytic transglycosylase domain-containing protein [Clostridium gasigenes]MBU3133641.1 lytic transglycosylase domain-containing protein [Clostridium gasigenes]